MIREATGVCQFHRIKPELRIASLARQSVKLSDELVLEARTAGAAARRSIAGQVEFWARLGKAIEPLLRGDRALALQRSGEAVYRGGKRIA